MLGNHLKVALRILRKHPGLSATSIVGLAVAMTCSVFLLLHVFSEMSYDRFHEKADRLYRVVTNVTAENGTASRSAYSFTGLGPVMLDGLPDLEAFARVRAHESSRLRIGEDAFLGERMLTADSTFFDLFTYRFLHGNPATALTRPYTVVLTRPTAERLFGTENPIGQIINLDDQYDLEVTAVIDEPPATSHLSFDLLSSFATQNALRPGRLDNNWNILYDYTYVLLGGRRSAEFVENRLPDLTSTYIQPLAKRSGNSFRFTLQPVTDIHLGSHREHEIEPGERRTTVYLLAAMAVLLVLIACINFMNLSTVQATARTREAGIRKAIGATRGQLTRQHLAESLVAAAMAMALAVVLFVVLLPVFNHLSGTGYSPGALGEFRIAVSFLIVTFVAGIGGGLYPALVSSASRPVSALRGEPIGELSAARVRKVLVATEFAFAIALMLAAMVVYKQLTFMRQAELGFDRDLVVVLDHVFPGPAASEAETIKNELLRSPDIRSVTIASEWPTRESNGQLPFRIEGMPLGEGLQIAWYQTDEDYLDVLGIELAAGRRFMPQIASDTAAILINEAGARHFGLDPTEAIGRRIYPPDEAEPSGYVIGVLRDFQTTSMHEAVRPVLIASYWARPRNILIKADGDDISGAIRYIESTWSEFMRDTPAPIAFLDDQYDALYHSEMRLSRVVNAFAVLAILVACLGLVGLSALIARQRTKEIGIRKVLGASVPSIVALLSKDFVQLVTVAFCIAAPVASVLMQGWLDSFAYRVEMGLGIFLVGGGLILAVSVGTIAMQALRVALQDPVQSLRYE